MSLVPHIDNASDEKKQLRVRNEDLPNQKKNNELVEFQPVRTSSLPAPIIQLQGHSAAVNTCKFSPTGKVLASAGFDKKIFLWSIPTQTDTGDDKQVQNYSTLFQNKHKKPITEICWSGDKMKADQELFSVSADGAVVGWNVVKGSAFLTIENAHKDPIITSVASGSGDVYGNLLITGGDDGVANIWDLRLPSSSFSQNPKKSGDNSSQQPRNLVCSLQNSEYKWPVATVSPFHEFNDTVYISGIDGIIRCFDLRKISTQNQQNPENFNNVLYEMSSHTDAVTGISISPNGNHLLSISMDNSLKIWDISMNFHSNSNNNRLVLTVNDYYDGNQIVLHSQFEKPLLRCSWAPNGKWITCGASDMPSSHVHVWKLGLYEKPKPKATLLYRLPGHLGAINEVVFHPQQPIVASCSNDKTIYLGEVMNYGI